MHGTKRYSNQVAGRLLRNYVPDIRIRKSIVISALSYSPKAMSVNKETRDLSNKIIEEELGYEAPFRPIHFN